jgi:hypothetical protein
MTPLKLVKVVHDGQSYWLLWHWDVLMLHTTKHLKNSTQFVQGPFSTIEQAETAIPKDWTPVPFQQPRPSKA